MKIESLKDRLEMAIGYAEKITSKNTTLPVLKCIYLKAEKNNLSIRATNLELGIEINIPVKVEKEGVVAVPGSVFYSFLSQIKDEKSVMLEEIEGNLKISTKNHSTLIKCFPYEDFPTIPQVTEGKELSVSAEELVKGFKSVWYSASVSSMKPELSSVYVYSDKGDLVFVATDAFRLAEKRVKSKKIKEFPSILIPFKNVSELIRILDGRSDDVEMKIDTHQISFKFDEVYVTSRIIDGNFPDYKALIPKEALTEVVILKQDFSHTLKIANVFADKFNKVTIKINPKDHVFEIKTKNSDVGESNNSLQGSMSGDDIEISFNYKNITDSFQSIDADSISLALNGLNKPLLIKGVSDDSFTYIVMPMNK